MVGTIQSFATHSMGADLTYEHITGNTYRITLKFYRDCAGISAPTTPNINISSNGCTASSIMLNQVGFRILPTSCGTTSSCFGGTLVGAEEYIYQRLVTLDPNCTDWKFSWQLCCRNNAITTLQNPGSHNFYIEAQLETPALNNNSPEFTGLPVIYVGVGQNVIYNHGVTDPDGDQLLFSLVNGLQGAGQPVTYSGGLSGTQPLVTAGPTTINANTGQVTFTPSIAQVGVISVKVEEFRNGIKIGEVTRDMQIIVAPNSNTPPIVSGINGTATSAGTTGAYTISVQSGSQFCFDLQAYDAQGNAITLNATMPPAATFISSPGSNAAQFCWTPTASDIGTHLLTVFAEDNGCPYPGNSSYVYYIEVLGANGQCSGSIGTSISTNTVTFTYNGPPMTSYYWDFGDGNSSSNQNPIYSYSAAGTYSVQLTAIGPNNQICVYATTVVIHNVGPCDANFTYDSDFFYPDYVSSTATYFWDFGDGTTSTQVQPPNNLPPGTWTVCLNMVNCADTCFSCQVITIGAPCDGEISSTAISHFTYQFELTGNTTPVLNYLWEFGDGNTSTQASPTYTYTNAGNYVVTLTTIDSLNNLCTYVDSINVCPTTCPLDVAVTVINASCDSTCTGIAIAASTCGTAPYTYQWSNGATSTTVSGLCAGTYTVTVVDAVGDIAVETVIISASSSMMVSVTTFPESSPGANDGSASATQMGGIPPFVIQWSNGQTGATATGLSAGYYCVTFTDQNGCSATACDSLGTSNLCDASFTNNNGVLTANDQNNPYYVWFTTTVNNPIGTQSTLPIVNYPPGTYVFCLNTGNNFQDTCTTCQPIIVGNCPLQIATTAVNASCFNSCDGSATAAVTCGVAPYTYTWSNGQTSPTASGLCAGTYSVTATDANGSTAVGFVTITEPPLLTVAVISQGNTATAVVNGGTPPYSYMWSNGATTQTAPGLPPGYYCVTVTDNNGCQAIACDTIVGGNVCDASFTYVNGVFAANDLTAQFYYWNLGDGTISYTPVVQHTYNTGGTYIACLSVISALGDSCMTCDSIYQAPPPTNCDAGFTFNNGVFAADIVNSQNSYYWDFGDGTTGTQPITQHGYAPGTYLACLEVYTAFGDSCMECDTIIVPPQANCNAGFTYLNGVFTPHDLNNSYYFWDFGDGDVSTQPVTQHGYTPGTYLACLYVETALGDSCQTCDTIYVQTPPPGNCNADFTYSPNGVLIADDLTNASYYWFNGNSGNYIGNLPIQPLNYQSGNYLICLSTLTALGDSCMTCDTITVNNFTNVSGVVQRNNKGISNSISVGTTPNGKPYAGLTVLLEDLSGNTVAKVVTDQFGKYEFKGIGYSEFLVVLDVGVIKHLGERIKVNQATPMVHLDFTVSLKNALLTNKSTQLVTFPNPTTGAITLQFENNLASPTMINVQNASGEVVLKREEFFDVGLNIIDVNLHRLPAGLYFIIVQNEDFFGQTKVVKITE